MSKKEKVEKLWTLCAKCWLCPYREKAALFKGRLAETLALAGA